ncbi:MAG: hypothetical protein ACRDJU_01750 [Actinomycetota bacterium]
MVAWVGAGAGTDGTAAWVAAGEGSSTVAGTDSFVAVGDGEAAGVAVVTVAGVPAGGNVLVVDAGAVAARPPMIPTKPPTESSVTVVRDWPAGWRLGAGSAERVGARWAGGAGNGLAGWLGLEELERAEAGGCFGLQPELQGGGAGGRGIGSPSPVVLRVEPVVRYRSWRSLGYGWR